MTEMSSLLICRQRLAAVMPETKCTKLGLNVVKRTEG